MSPSVAHAVPTAGALRTLIRQKRRGHRQRSFWETFNDLYTLAWVFVVYGGVLVAGVRRHLTSVAPQASAEARWIMVAALFAGAGLVWQALRTVGPLLATPAEQAWALSAPVDRRAWLKPRFAALVAALGLGSAVVALATAVALRGGSLAWAALAGLAVGTALAAASVAAQDPDATHRWWARAPAWVLLGGGMLTTGAVVAAHYAGWALGLPRSSGVLLLTVLAVPLAAIALRAATRALGRLDRFTLGAGAQVASATVTAAVGLDPSLLSGVLEVRRWRRVGQVRSRHLGGGPFGPTLSRTWVLLRTELIRQTRRPAALALFAALALAQYAVAVAVPSAAPVTRLILAYLAAGRLSSGLRALAGSPGLRRAIGGAEWELRAAHLVVPTLGVALWWLLTWPTSGAPLGRSALLWMASVVAAAYRSATRPPMSYESAALETPFGQLPFDLIRQMVRGPDLLGMAIVVRMLTKG